MFVVVGGGGGGLLLLLLLLFVLFCFLTLSDSQLKSGAG